jgi:hypothetical protein
MRLYGESIGGGACHQPEPGGLLGLILLVRAFVQGDHEGEGILAAAFTAIEVDCQRHLGDVPVVEAQRANIPGLGPLAQHFLVLQEAI